MLPGMMPLPSVLRKPFASFDVTSNTNWVVPEGVRRIRIQARAASAVGTWVPIVIRLLRISRSISSTGTDGALNRSWSDWFTGSPLLAEYQKFLSGLPGADGKSITYNYRSGAFVYRYATNTSPAPRWSTATTLTGFLESTRTRRYRNYDVPNPTGWGSDAYASPIAYTNWGGTNVDFNVNAEEYQYVGRGGVQSVVGSVSGALQSLSDLATFIPEDAAVSVFPPTGNSTPTSNLVHDVTPGETLTFAFSATGAGRQFEVIDAG